MCKNLVNINITIDITMLFDLTFSSDSSAPTRGWQVWGFIIIWTAICWIFYFKSICYFYKIVAWNKITNNAKFLLCLAQVYVLIAPRRRIWIISLQALGFIESQINGAKAVGYSSCVYLNLFEFLDFFLLKKSCLCFVIKE